MSGFTPGPWWVRTRVVGGQIADCFVAANDVQGVAYDAEILGDDEYRDGIERKLADARLIAAAPDGLDAGRELLGVVKAAIASGDWKVDGACDPDMAIRRMEAFIAKATGADA